MLSKERMREYQKERRAKLRGIPVKCASCEDLKAVIVALKNEIAKLKAEISSYQMLTDTGTQKMVQTIHDGIQSVIKTKADAVKIAKSLPVNRVQHAASCNCMMCKPKEKS